MFDAPLVTTDQSIDRVLCVNLPLALVFLDGDPGPELEQAMSRLARENSGKLLVVKVRVRDSPAVARRFEISTTPAVVGLKVQATVTRAEGIGSADLDRHVAYLLGKRPTPDSAGRAAEPAAAGRSKPRPSGPARGQTSSEGRPVVVTDSSFDEEVMRSQLPVLVDFWAPWCGPCRMVEPAVEQLAQQHAGRLRVAKVNVDQNPAVARRYDVHSIPTMMVVKEGKIVERWAGALPEPALRSRVQRWLAR